MPLHTSVNAPGSSVSADSVPVNERGTVRSSVAQKKISARPAVDVASTFSGQIEDPPTNDYSAESVEGVIDKAKQGINDLKEAVRQAEQKIVDAMQNSSGVVSSYASDFVAPRPSLAGEHGKPPKDPDVGRPDAD